MINITTQVIKEKTTDPVTSKQRILITYLQTKDKRTINKY